MKLPMKYRPAIAFVILLVLASTVWLWGRRGILPTQRAMVEMKPSELRSLVLQFTPIGADRADVENTLQNSFLRDWTVKNAESIEYMSNHGFQVPISDGDYYLTSEFATVGIFARIATVKFLFDRENKLKDVHVRIWDEDYTI